MAGSVGGVLGGAEVVLMVSDEPLRLSVDALLLVLATLSVFLCSDTRLCVRVTLGFAFGSGGTGIFASFFTGVPEILLLVVEVVDVVERMDGVIDGAFLTTGLLVEGDFEAKLVVDFVVLTEEVLKLDAVELFREREVAVLYAVLAPSFVVFVLTVETRELGRDDTIDNGGRKLEAGVDFLTVEAWLLTVRTDAMDAVDFGLDNEEDVDATDRREETDEGPTIFLGKGALGVVRASVSSAGSLSEGVGVGEDGLGGVSFESGRGSVTFRRGDEAEVELEATENLDAAVRTLRTEGVMDAFDRAGRLRERTLTRMDCMSLSLSASFGGFREARGVFFAPPLSAGFRRSSTGISILSLISLIAHPSISSNPPSFLTPNQRLRNQDKTSSLVCST